MDCVGFEAFRQKSQIDPFAVLWKTVYEYLRQCIITFQLKPETRLNEIKLASRLQVSRTTVKTAVDRLVEDGLVIRKVGSGAYVSAISRADCLQLYHARLALEGQAAYLAAENIRQETLDRLKKILQDFEAIRSTKNKDNLFAQADHTFHDLIIKAANNPYISQMYDCIKNRVFRYRHYISAQVYQEITDLTATQSHHKAIYNALKNRFADVARTQIQMDIHSMNAIMWRLK